MMWLYREIGDDFVDLRARFKPKQNSIRLPDGKGSYMQNQ